MCVRVSVSVSERERREREKEGDKRNDRGTSPVHSMRREGERERWLGRKDRACEAPRGG